MTWKEFCSEVRNTLSPAENKFNDDISLYAYYQDVWTVEDTVLAIKEAFKDSGHDENERCQFCGQHCDDNCDEAQADFV